MRAEAVWRRVLALLAISGAAALHAQAPTPLKTLEPPGGGHIVYGQVDGATTESAAMGTILRSLHRQYADKPQVGKVFQVKDSNSAAVFFTLVKRNQGNAPIAGLIIARSTGPSTVEAALLSDDAARFGTTVNPMLKTLFGVWHPAVQSATATPGTAAPEPLTRYELPDHTASVSLPAGWKVEPSSGGGTILADGPHGEAASLNFPFLAMNSSDPRVQQTMRFAQGAGRNTSYGHGLYYPYGADPGKTFVDLLQMRRRVLGLGPVNMQLTGETPLAAQGPRCAQLKGRIDDPADGKGMREFNTVFCVGPLSPMGQYMSLAWHTAVPLAYADRERSTMSALLASFQVNARLVSQQAAAIAAPAIEHIHAIGRAAAAQAQQAHAMNDLHNQSVEARWDSQDRHNQAFSNYLLDQTVISDNQNNAHATVWNQTADAMVHANPQRFGYVDTPDFWKGVDY
jgi:hypothetical protein